MSLSFQCMVNTMTHASSYHISPGWRFTQHRPAPKSHLKRYLKALLKDQEVIDSRILAISWIESRLRPYIHRGDRGKACGLFQIHARYSYPLFRRKGGFSGWVESEEKQAISRECRKLENISYAIDTVERLLKMMDDKNLHPCHHNSGFYGKCNTWYKQRLDYWVTYFEIAQFVCDDERKIDFMAMMRTGNPIPTAPANMIQGYIDAMGGKDPQSEDSVYKSGYDLAKLVQEGKAQPPTWATEKNPSSALPSGEDEREG